MVRLKQTARKSTGIHVPGPLESLWHPALTEAMEQGTPGALAAAASAQSYRPEPDLQYLVEQQFELRHSLCEQPEQLVQRSPFLPESAFGMAPYAGVWRAGDGARLRSARQPSALCSQLQQP